MSGSDHIRHVALLNVRRTLVFYLLGVLTVFMGFSEHIDLAIRSTAIMLTLLTGFLLFRAWRAPHVAYCRDNVWRFLAWMHRVPERHLQRLLATTLRRTWLAYADFACIASLVCWLLFFADTLLLRHQ